MAEVKQYIQTLLNAKGITISANRQVLFEEFVKAAECEEAVNTIVQKQNQIMEKWKIKNRIADIIAQQVVIPNATIGKAYEAKIDFQKLNLNDLIFEKFEGLEEIGLNFNPVNDTIEGTPTKSGDVKIKLLFKIEGQSENSPTNEKLISLVVNPDPKSLWKDIPSDTNDLFWKEDDISKAEKLGEKNIVVSSKRGRSHKNVGSFRDDDFAYKHFEKTGWSLVVVSDGAGSATLARKGSQLACNSVVDYFENHLEIEKAKDLENKIEAYALRTKVF